MYFKRENDKKERIYIEDDRKYIYVTSLSFVQETEYNEGCDAKNISQYPLEDILDKFSCYVSDFYENINTATSKVCFLEFASCKLEHIRELLKIVDKHVYNKEENGRVKLIIE